ncbi:stalk domain-containing protein [Texcoconibacillus texcoconensis]|uniref:Tetratricopeptide (TPR) repeat protein n=1 Tax=Texcoconibacillus texcoconensis TaxID=1095777 RepID=A0A840QRA3_9BACI|nr:stalk domain-containing protein [Texcoconibacillus texcoconensis]MBB5173853.1 tetratricopeptide (TPR) repeat protein [Texcoconibacillus texcoconensis]
MQKNLYLFTSLLTLVLAVTFLFPSTSESASMWSIYSDAEEARNNGEYNAALQNYEAVLPSFLENEGNTNIAMIYNRMGSMQVELGLYEEAVESWEQEANYWEKEGSTQSAIAATSNANDLRSDVQLFREADSHAVADQYDTGAKFEPEIGALLGAYAEEDDAVHDSTSGNPHYIEEFPNLVNHDHAAYLLYVSWGTPFSQLASHIRRAEEQGVAMQLALQPDDGLGEVQDGEYIRQFAQDAANADIPIFLRFANEMNGEWVEWYDEPERYIDKYRTVANVFQQEADNVAMVWAPNYFPPDNITDYYPGDHYVDWVGVSMYQRHNGEDDLLGEGVDRSSYVEKFEHIYDLYADRKPIFISEGAVSHIDPNTNEGVTEWATRHVETFYNSLPMLYPGVKAVFWFSSDGQSANDYRLSQNDQVLNAYQEAIQNDFYLSNIGDMSPVTYLPVDTTGVAPTETALHAHVETIDPLISKVEYYVNGALAGTSTEPSWSINYDFLSHRSETVEIEVKVYGEDGHLVTTDTQNIGVGATNVELNNAQIDFDTQAQIKNDRTFIPVRQIAESLGADVSWDATTQTADIEHNDTTLSMTIGDKTVYQNQQPETIDAAPFLDDNRTFLPLRFIIEGLGLELDWNEDTYTTSFTTE